MRVLILSKTKMKQALCVGGITQDGILVRLLTKECYNQPLHTSLRIGQVWEIEYKRRENCIAPHVEDICILSQKYTKKQYTFVEIVEILDKFHRKNKITIWRGHPEKNLFDGCIIWSLSESSFDCTLIGYINESCIPNHSVGFWLPDKDLSLCGERYEYYDEETGIVFSIKYVGEVPPIKVIPAYTLCRISLARWWDTNGRSEQRCYLQLSGFYK